jgi:hypothetical protein
MPCASRAPNACATGAGCSPVYCTGTPEPCDLQFDFMSCDAVGGCYWAGSSCTGDPLPCDSIMYSTSCFAQGCRWDDLVPACGGYATPCSSLGAAQCASQPGCVSLVDDAGTNDAGHDAASSRDVGVDAGMCRVTDGTCDPFSSSTTCGFGQTCISAGMAPHCTVSAFTLHNEGETCANDDDCAAGLDCASTDGGATLHCTRFCHFGSATDCAAGTRCQMPAYTGATCAYLCVPMPGTCDVVAQSCASGQGCYVYFDDVTMTDTSGCYRAGTLTVGSSCSFINDCMPGASCIGGSCRRTCHTTSDCTTGTCSGSVPGGFQYCA